MSKALQHNQSLFEQSLENHFVEFHEVISYGKEAEQTLEIHDADKKCLKDGLHRYLTTVTNGK